MKTLSKKNIWIVDDDKPILEALKIVLEQKGYEVKIIFNGKQFYRAMKKSSPDVILLDVYIADSNGRDIIKSLKIDEKTKNIPVILATADVFAIKNAKKDRYRADEFLSKPFGISDLLTIIKKYI